MMLNMDFLIWFFIFSFGAIVGSFLNVVILRYNTGASIAMGKSACFSCAKNLFWYELFPIASFVALKGRCGNCKSKISWQYPLVEFFTGFIFLLTFLMIFNQSFAFFEFSFNYLLYIFYYWSIFSLLIVITVYDIRHKIIPDLLVFSFAGLSLTRLIFNFGIQDLFHSPFIFDLLAGPILALPFFLMWLFSKGRWMGLGDAKLALGIGWFLGLFSGISAVILGFWIGAAFSLLIILFQRLNLTGKRITIKSEIPFAPFLVIGLLLVFFFGFDALSLGSLF